MQRSPTLLIPGLLFLLSFFLRVSLLSKGPFHLDSLNLAIQSAETLRTHQLHFLFGIGYPVAVVLGTIFVAIGSLLGNSDPVFGVNLMSAFCGALAVVIFYLLAEKWT